jgi:hypothetical protein
MAARLERLCEEGNIGNPIVLEDFQWDNEWVDNQNEKVREEDDLAWAHVDNAGSCRQCNWCFEFPSRS